MPLIILLKAACTALDGETCPAGAVLFWVVGDASSSVDLVTRFGVGEGFGATLRVREGVGEEFVFCAGTKAALTSTTETTTINLFTIISPPTNRSLSLAVLLKFMPGTLAAQTHYGILAADDLKDLKH